MFIEDGERLIIGNGLVFDVCVCLVFIVFSSPFVNYLSLSR